MKVYNQDKTQILETYDLEKGYLVPSTIVNTTSEIQEKKEVGHFVTKATYPNGGKDVEWVVDVPGVKYQPAKTVVEDIYIYIPYTAGDLAEIELNKLREKREQECFPVINRGQFWYDSLTSEQRISLRSWYQAWLDVTLTKVVPTKPTWLN